ncbi:high light inducible protein [Synechococcus phage ACG-2014h]|uniref:High light inducible protein n=1 Tax=Synechococcus phage ACG-2014h TaxID=1340810 RepID=V5USU6_9CAUD|nr:high light inducible protein [Synechococcus phage ACG-2014h]AHB80602.1 high light inducible protein [Synechococcus phage ACG-2014h]
MTVTTEDGGRTNMFASEPTMYMTKEDLDRYGIETYAERAEKLNGRVAMLGIISGMLSYAITGKFFFGAF